MSEFENSKGFGVATQGELNEIAVPKKSLEEEMIRSGDVYSMLPKETMEEKINYFNATSNPDKRVKDCINMDINVRYVYAERVQLRDEVTQELQDAIRIILVDTEGVSYACVSGGVFHSIQRLLDLFNKPEYWENGIAVTVKQVTKGTNAILTLELAKTKATKKK